MRFPTVFLSHGAPTLPIDPTMPWQSWFDLGRRLPRPRAILMVSAHWETEAPCVSTSARPSTIHDFYGFPPELYRLNYPAPGAPDLALDVQRRLKTGGFPAHTVDRGLDHGAWNPLLLLFPEADIPVTQLSIQPQQTPAYHRALGQTLSTLPEEEVLILASGQITHNLRAASFHARPNEVDERVLPFTTWIDERLKSRDVQALDNYRALAPDPEGVHPTDEHLLPLFVALGAAGENHDVEAIAMGTFQRSLTMTHYLFKPKLVQSV